jgi:ABC-type nitrate/sulfonate/bicarbonate transport system permease component
MASALSSNAEIVFFDETFVSMDSELLSLNLSQMREYVDAGNVGACVVVSHDPEVLSICDQVYQVHFERKFCSLRKMPSELQHNEATPKKKDISRSINRYSVRSNERKVSSIIQTVLSSLIAIILVFGLLSTPSLSLQPKVRQFMPSMSKLINELHEVYTSLILEGAWSLLMAFASCILVILISLTYWYFVLAVSKSIRSYLLTTWIAFQSIPIIVIAPIIHVFFGVNIKVILEVSIGVFIAVFPVGIIGARVLIAAPHDVFRSYAAFTPFRRLLTGMKWAWGSILRAIVSCSPLAAIGVVVGEYVIGQRGLGNLVFRTISSGELESRWIYAIGCVSVACILLITTSIIAVTLLPKDIKLD